ncbi:MAG TPA: hypothetical protein VI814_12785 [Candidatus Limnocylindria bacterium]
MSDDELLDQLVGTWRISGEMRGEPLAQRAVAQRALGGRFVEIRVTGGTPLVEGRPYEAAYFIGSAGPGRFVMTLLDVFGAAFSAVPGLGRRDGDAIVFEFAYANGPWTWRWSFVDGVWEHEQTYLENGERKTFATKHMTRD